jgi:MoaA/NifB/PqqE/SkfB family radical SAM enzyme/phosphoglycolate phosphatase-like HAD superfamily hydrolase
MTAALFLFMELFTYAPPTAFAQPISSKVQGGTPSGLHRLVRDTEIRIPPELGRIDESFHGTSNKTILYIQDAHDSLEAQENIANMINHLVANYGVKTVFEEGYEGPVPTDKYFGFIKDPKIKEKVAYFLMDHLRLGGAEYAHINRAEDFDLMGADSLKLHKENVNQYRLSSVKKGTITKDLKALEKELKALSDSRFPKELKEWLKTKEGFDAKKLDLFTYLERTMPLLGKREAEKGVGLIGFILEAVRSNDPVVIEKAKHIDAREIFSEVIHLEQVVAETYLHHTVDKQLFEYYKILNLLHRLNDLQVSQEEYEAVKASLKAFDTDSFARFIFSQAPKTLILSRMWERNIKEAIQFYEIAEARDKAIERSFAGFFNGKTNPALAVLVYGGFHKENIKRLLEAKEISYLVVSPRFTTPSPRHEEFYKRLMIEGRLSYELPANLKMATRAESRLEVWESANPLLARAELRVMENAIRENINFDSRSLSSAVEQALKTFASGSLTRSEARGNEEIPDPSVQNLGRVDGVSGAVQPFTLPPVVNFHVTSRCNLRCPHCCGPNLNSIKKSSLNQIRATLQALRNQGVYNIGFTGGEPLVLDQIEQVVRYAKEIQFKVTLYTNGLALLKFLPLIRDSIDLVSISLDGPESINDRFFRNRGHFARVKETLAYIQSNPFPFELQVLTVVGRANRDSIVELGQLLREWGLPKRITWRLNKFVPFGRGKDNREQFELQPEEFDSVVRKVESEFPDIKIRHSPTQPVDMTYVYVHPNGDLFTSIGEKPVFLGNVLDRKSLLQHLEEFNQIREMRALRKSTRNILPATQDGSASGQPVPRSEMRTRLAEWAKQGVTAMPITHAAPAEILRLSNDEDVRAYPSNAFMLTRGANGKMEVYVDPRGPSKANIRHIPDLYQAGSLTAPCARASEFIPLHGVPVEYLRLKKFSGWQLLPSEVKQQLEELVRGNLVPLTYKNGVRLAGWDVVMGTTRDHLEAPGRTGELIHNGRFMIAQDASGYDFSLDVKGIGPPDGTFVSRDRRILTGIVDGQPHVRDSNVLVGYRRRVEFDGNDRLEELTHEPANAISAYPIPAFTLRFTLNGEELAIEGRLSPGNRRMGQYFWGTQVGTNAPKETAKIVGGAMAYMLLQEKPSVHFSVNLENFYYPSSTAMAAYANPEKSTPLFDQRRAYEVFNAGISMAEGRVGYEWRHYENRHDELLSEFWKGLIDVFVKSGVFAEPDSRELEALSREPFSEAMRQRVLSILWSRYMVMKIVENRAHYGYRVSDFLKSNKSTEHLFPPLEQKSGWVREEVEILKNGIALGEERNMPDLIRSLLDQGKQLEAILSKIGPKDVPSGTRETLRSLIQKAESLTGSKTRASAGRSREIMKQFTAAEILSQYKQDWDGALERNRPLWTERTPEGVPFGLGNNVSIAFDPSYLPEGKVGPFNLDRRPPGFLQYYSDSFTAHINDPKFRMMRHMEEPEGPLMIPNLLPKGPYQSLLFSKTYREQRLTEKDGEEISFWLNIGLGVEYHFTGEHQKIRHFHIHLFLPDHEPVFEASPSFLEIKKAKRISVGYLKDFPVPHLALYSPNERDLQSVSLAFSNFLQDQQSPMQHTIVLTKRKDGKGSQAIFLLQSGITSKKVSFTERGLVLLRKEGLSLDEIISEVAVKFRDSATMFATFDAFVNASTKSRNDGSAFETDRQQGGMLAAEAPTDKRENSVGQDSRSEMRTFVAPSKDGLQIRNQEAVRKAVIKAVAADWDGTLSRLREGWEVLFIPVAASVISGRKVSEADMMRIVEDLKADLWNGHTVPGLEVLVEKGVLKPEDVAWARKYIDSTKGNPINEQMREVLEQAQRNKVLEGRIDEARIAATIQKFYGKLFIVRDWRIAELQAGRKTMEQVLMPGALQFLKECKTRGIPLRIITGSDKSVRDEILKLGLVDLIDVSTLSSIDVGGGQRQKSKKEIMAEMKQQYGLGDFELLVVGDGSAETSAGTSAAIGALTVLLKIRDNEAPEIFDRLLSFGPHVIVQEDALGRLFDLIKTAPSAEHPSEAPAVLGPVVKTQDEELKTQGSRDGNGRSEVRDPLVAPIMNKAVLVIEQATIDAMTPTDFKRLLALAGTRRSEIRLVIPGSAQDRKSNRLEALKSAAKVDFRLPEIARSGKVSVFGFASDSAGALRDRLNKLDGNGAGIAGRLDECFALDEGIDGIVLALLVANPEDLPMKQGLRYDGTGRFRSEIRAFVEALLQNFVVVSTAA